MLWIFGSLKRGVALKAGLAWLGHGNESSKLTILFNVHALGALKSNAEKGIRSLKKMLLVEKEDLSERKRKSPAGNRYNYGLEVGSSCWDGWR